MKPAEDEKFELFAAPGELWVELRVNGVNVDNTDVRPTLAILRKHLKIAHHAGIQWAIEQLKEQEKSVIDCGCFTENFRYWKWLEDRANDH